MRVLHVLHTSLPHICGYSIRSDRILTFERELGIELSAVTSAQQPSAALDQPGVIPHARTPRPRLWPSPGREVQLIMALRRSTAAAITRFRPDIVHAHSPVLVGLPAYLAARRAGVPIVYEVRDLWENASVDRGKFAADSFAYKAARGLETWLLQRADAVVTICDALRGELQPRCRPSAVVTVVGNGVDLEAFEPRAPDRALRRTLGVGEDGVLMAYIGAFQPYEGLELLIDAMPVIVSQIPNARLVIVGDGPERGALEGRARAGDAAGQTAFLGRVPHGEVARLYAAADLMIYPRVLTRTTELTTPLKPLEAMAMARCVLASDVRAMQEIVVEGVSGTLFRAGDADDLARKAIALLCDPDRRAALGRSGRAWVQRERGWQALVPGYSRLYERLSPAAAGHPAEGHPA